METSFFYVPLSRGTFFQRFCNRLVVSDAFIKCKESSEIPEIHLMVHDSGSC